MDEFLDELRELTALYSRTKGYVLRAEEIDPSSRSNIAIFKEQRDALDHVMRALGECLSPEKATDREYMSAQIDKARGHLFRASYDALDGVAVSCKVRIHEVMDDVPLDAIAAVHKEYWDRISDLDEIDARIVQHRQSKDVKRSTMENLEGYSKDVERVCELSRDIIKRAPAYADWRKRQKRKNAVYLLLFPVIIGVVLALAKFGLDIALLRAKTPKVEPKQEQKETPPAPKL